MAKVVGKAPRLGQPLIRTTPVDMYGERLTVMVNMPWADAYAYIKRRHKAIEPIEAKFNGRSFSVEVGDTETGERCRFYYVWMREFNWWSSQQALLVHEIYHHVNAVLDAAGVSWSADNNEAYAYYLQWVYQEVLDILKAVYPNAQKARR